MRVIRETPVATRYPITGHAVSEREYTVPWSGERVVEVAMSDGSHIYRSASSPPKLPPTAT